MFIGKVNSEIEKTNQPHFFFDIKFLWRLDERLISVTEPLTFNVIIVKQLVK